QIEAEQDAAGHAKHVLGHVAEDIPKLTWLPFRDHFCHQVGQGVAIFLNGLFLERLKDHAAMPFVLLAVHGQEAAGQAALGGILGTAKSEKPRMKCLGIAQDLLCVMWSEDKNEPLTLFFERRNVAVKLL